MSDTDVLVVGAGPTGLMAAVTLRRHGVQRVRVIERDLERKTWAKATAVHARSLEIFKSLGDDLNKSFLGRTTKPVGMKMVNYTRGTSIEADLPTSLKMHLVEQWHTEACLEKFLLDQYGVAVERGVSAVGFQDSGNEVRVQTEKTKPKEELKEGGEQQKKPTTEEEKKGERGEIVCSYVIASDGAHSIFRKSLGIEFPGHQLPGSFLVYQGVFDLDKGEDAEIGVMRTGANGFMLDTPLPGGQRLAAMDLSPEQKARCQEGTSPSDEDVLRECRERGMKANAVHDTVWSSFITLHSRQASQYKKGRVFIAGDAGHVHSPVLGQGMNMGLQDAHNLGWKLALVVTGQAEPALLETYNEERHEIDRKTLKFIETAHSAALVRNPVFLYLRDQVATLAPAAQKYILGIASQTSYSYFFSSLSVEDWRWPTSWYLTARLERREMFIRRNAGVRVRAGDRSPDAEVECSYAHPPVGDSSSKGRIMLSDFYSQKTLDKGTIPFFQALLFEGMGNNNNNNNNKKQNDKNNDNDSNVTLLREIEAKTAGLVTSFAVVASSDKPAHRLFGVKDLPCLFLIRPDGYVGLRVEPAAVDAVLSYLHSNVHSTRIPRPFGVRAPGIDYHPVIAGGVILSGIGAFGAMLFLDKDRNSVGVLSRAVASPLRIASLASLSFVVLLTIKTVWGVR